MCVWDCVCACVRACVYLCACVRVCFMTLNYQEAIYNSVSGCALMYEIERQLKIPTGMNEVLCCLRVRHRCKRMNIMNRACQNGRLSHDHKTNNNSTDQTNDFRWRFRFLSFSGSEESHN